MAGKRIRDAVGIDPDRVAAAAIDAALGRTQQPRKHHPVRVAAAGAALAAAAAVGQKHLPRFAKLPMKLGLEKLGDMANVDEFADALRERFTGHGTASRDGDDNDDYEDEDYENEEFDDGPTGESDEDFDDEPPDEADDESESDEEDEEPEPEEDEEREPEGDEESEPDEADEDIAARSAELGIDSERNGVRSADRTPDLFRALRQPHRRPPVMRQRSRRLDPAAHPPEPEPSRRESSPTDERSQPRDADRSKKRQKSTAGRK
jgi:hypothetical protein